MKTLLRKKWFRRICQTLLVMVSLLILAYAAINWWGARAKRDVIARMRAEGRPTSIAETLKPLPRDEDNFAMIPILAQARDEWWLNTTHGGGQPPGQASLKLSEMAFKEGRRNLTREGKPDLSVWKKNYQLTGSDAQCLETYDRKFGGILAELREGMRCSETASPIMHRLAASAERDFPYLSASYSLSLAEVAESLGFRAELALAADRPEQAHESLLIAIRLSELVGSEGFMISRLIQGRVIRYLQPTLARALQTAGWDKARISSIRYELGALNQLEGIRHALDIENLTIFARFEGAKKHPDFISWARPFDVPEWQYDILTRNSSRLPTGWYRENAAVCARMGLQLRDEIGEGVDLRTWLKACERDGNRGQLTSSWEYWVHPMKINGFGRALEQVCRNQTLIQQAVLACDLETYRIDHGRYPERLQETGSPVITDSMTGEPFIYRLTDSGYLLYSIGSDGKDNGGNQSKADAYRKRDWVW